MKIKVLGGGFSGLTMAYALCKKGIPVDLHESSARLGGLIGTQKTDWGIVETAANGIMASQNVIELFEDLSLDYLSPKKENQKRYIFRGRPRRFPLTAIESTNLIWGLLSRKAPKEKETLYNYGLRCFGKGATNYLVEPALLGIFGADSESLSANLVHDYLFKYKPTATSKVKGTLAPKAGMASLIQALANFIDKNGGNIHLNSEFTDIDGSSVFLATPAYSASEILKDRLPNISSCLSQISYVPLSSVTLGFKENSRNLNGFGCLFPRPEKFHSLGVLFNNDIFKNRGPSFTETWIISDVESDDQELIRKIIEDRRRIALNSESPDFFSVQRWTRALPHYSVQLEENLKQLHLPKGLYLVGNYMGRLGLGKILDQNLDLADRVVKDEP